MRRLPLALPVLCLAPLLVLPACGGTGPALGGPAPPLEVGTWVRPPPGADLAALRGRVVFLEFWASW